MSTEWWKVVSKRELSVYNIYSASGLDVNVPVSEGIYAYLPNISVEADYIEPVYHALAASKLKFANRPNGVMKAAFLGGGPVPEILRGDVTGFQVVKLVAEVLIASVHISPTV